MPSYLLCPKYIDYSCNDGHLDHYADVLFAFIQDNPLKIIMDLEDDLLTRYESKLADNELFRMWINQISNKIQTCVTHISIEDSFEDDQSLLVCLAIESCETEKVIAAKEKKDFRALIDTITSEKISLEDKEEFRDRIKKMTGGTTILNYGGQVSTGTNSPNIEGNRNKIEK